MKFFIDFAACCGSRTPADEATLLVPPETQRRRKRGRTRSTGAGEWRPSLSSISEENRTDRISNRKTIERPMIAEWRRCLKRKMMISSQRDRSRSSYFHHERGGQMLDMMQSYSPTPFMF